MAGKLLILLTEDEELKDQVESMLDDDEVTIVSTDDPMLIVRWMQGIIADLVLVDTSICRALIPQAAEAIKELKTSDITCNVPIVALAYRASSRSDKEGRAALAAGVDDILLMPLVLDDLQDKLGRHLYKQSNDRKLGS